MLFHNLEMEVVLPNCNKNVFSTFSVPLFCPTVRSYLHMLTCSFQNFLGNLFSYSLFINCPAILYNLTLIILIIKCDEVFLIHSFPSFPHKFSNFGVQESRLAREVRVPSGGYVYG